MPEPHAPRRRGRPRSDPDRLPPHLVRALTQFMAGSSYADIARTNHVKLDTVRHWFSDPRMRRALDRELWAIKELAVAQLMGHAPDAVRVILEGLTAERFSERLRAAEMLLERAGIKAAEGPRVTVVELPQVVEVTEAGGDEGVPGPGDAQHKGCYLCDEGARVQYWWRNVVRRALAVGEHREPAPSSLLTAP